MRRLACGGQNSPVNLDLSPPGRESPLASGKNIVCPAVVNGNQPSTVERVLCHCGSESPPTWQNVSMAGGWIYLTPSQSNSQDQVLTC